MAWKPVRLVELLRSYQTKEGGNIYAVAVISNPSLAVSNFRSFFAKHLGAKVIALEATADALNVTNHNRYEVPNEQDVIFLWSKVAPPEMLNALSGLEWSVKPRPGLKPLESVIDSNGGTIVGEGVSIGASHLQALDAAGFEFRIRFRFIGVIETLPALVE